MYRTTGRCGGRHCGPGQSLGLQQIANDGFQTVSDDLVAPIIWVDRISHQIRNPDDAVEDIRNEPRRCPLRKDFVLCTVGVGEQPDLDAYQHDRRPLPADPVHDGPEVPERLFRRDSPQKPVAAEQDDHYARIQRQYNAAELLSRSGRRVCVDRRPLVALNPSAGPA